MTALFGPVRVGDGMLAVGVAPGPVARFGPAFGAVLERSGAADERVPAEFFQGVNSVRFPTRPLLLGRLLVALSWLSPKSAGFAEPTGIQINFGVRRWGTLWFQTWDLGRPAQAPFSRQVARQAEVWMVRASSMGLDVMVDEAAFGRYIRIAGDSRRERDLGRAFDAAVGRG